jgi:hypothetical protein
MIRLPPSRQDTFFNFLLSLAGFRKALI